ncbi:hypothetical protein Sjap_025678 [Stephania japonica]|uniref:Uncharacterized protein n=1 Tax=Stephania japonica TaxID=461633 RepID=A0AAP0E5M2_9MAGN
MWLQLKNQLLVLSVLLVLLLFTNIATPVDLWKPEKNGHAVYPPPPQPLSGAPSPIPLHHL